MKVEGSTRFTVAVTVQRSAAGVNDRVGSRSRRGVVEPQFVGPLTETPQPAVRHVEIEAGIAGAGDGDVVVTGC